MIYGNAGMREKIPIFLEWKLTSAGNAGISHFPYFFLGFMFFV
jgi:hypothetical protein